MPELKGIETRMLDGTIRFDEVVEGSEFYETFDGVLHLQESPQAEVEDGNSNFPPKDLPCVLLIANDDAYCNVLCTGVYQYGGFFVRAFSRDAKGNILGEYIKVDTSRVAAWQVISGLKLPKSYFTKDNSGSEQ